LAKLGSKAVPALVEAMQNQKYAGRSWVIETLAAIGPPAKGALPAVNKALRDREDKQFHLLLEAKWRIDGDAAYAVRELVPLLDTKQGRQCGGAVTVLAGMGRDGKDAVPAIIRAVKKYHDHNLVYALGELGHHAKEQAIPALKEAMTRSETAVQAAAALRDLGLPAAELVPELLRMFDRCREARIDPYRIAHEIAACGWPATLPGLVRALEHPNPAVRPAAAWALCRVGADKKDVIAALTRALDDKHASEEATRSLLMIREAM
jgi:HEAT repeat protein